MPGQGLNDGKENSLMERKRVIDNERKMRINGRRSEDKIGEEKKVRISEL